LIESIIEEDIVNGHVLTVSHKKCSYGCLIRGTDSDGYFLSVDQKIKARIKAFNQSI